MSVNAKKNIKKTLLLMITSIFLCCCSFLCFSQNHNLSYWDKYNIAKKAINDKSYKKAEKILSDLLTKQQNFHVYILLSEAYAHQGQPQNALLYYLKAYQLSMRDGPSEYNKMALFGIAKIELALNNIESAKKYYKELLIYRLSSNERKIVDDNLKIINLLETKQQRQEKIPQYLNQPRENKHNHVILTFDDGPLPPYTVEILSILKKNNIQAVFFVLGKNVEKYPELVRKAYENGNSIACHGVNHIDLTKASQKEIEEEVMGCAESVRKVIGKTPICYRPAYNKMTPDIEAYIASKKMQTIRVQIDSTDWKFSKADDIISNIMSLISPRMNIIFHDGSTSDENRTETVKALPTLIHKIKTMGLYFERICYPLS